MTKLQTEGLGGLIFSSAVPDQLAKFYREVIGIPLELNSHGGLPEHWECDYQGIHYAILPAWSKEDNTNSIIPSFVVKDIETFILQHKLETLHPIMKLDEGRYVVTTKDIDGNAIRLWMGRAEQ
ncbi:MAG: hypothetical protein MI974_21505 [Chitinophagales bacterium]|nr:hypothetical protein [Chitinophagales bacterium]